MPPSGRPSPASRRRCPRRRGELAAGQRGERRASVSAGRSPAPARRPARRARPQSSRASAKPPPGNASSAEIVRIGLRERRRGGRAPRPSRCDRAAAGAPRRSSGDEDDPVGGRRHRAGVPRRHGSGWSRPSSTASQGRPRTRSVSASRRAGSGAATGTAQTGAAAGRRAARSPPAVSVKTVPPARGGGRLRRRRPATERQGEQQEGDRRSRTRCSPLDSAPSRVWLQTARAG